MHLLYLLLEGEVLLPCLYHKIRLQLEIVIVIYIFIHFYQLYIFYLLLTGIPSSQAFLPPVDDKEYLQLNVGTVYLGHNYI